MPRTRRLKNVLKVLTLLGLRLLFLLRKWAAGRLPHPPLGRGKILIVETAFLGDVVSATPLIRELAARWPQARITALIQARHEAILRHHPSLSSLELINSFSLSALYGKIRRLRRQDYQVVICASPGVKNSLLALLAGRRRVMGYLAYYSLQPYYYQDHRVDSIGGEGQWLYQKDQHIIRRALLAAAPLLGPEVRPSPPEIHLDPAREAEILDRLQRAGVLSTASLNLVVHPGASNPDRRWPASHLIEVLARLRAERPQGLNIILIGVRAEGDLCRQISEALGEGVQLFLERDLEEACVLIKHCQLFLGSDSGPKFLADAFARPMVILYGPQRPETVGALTPQAISLYHQIDCNPCPQVSCPHQSRCVRSITPEEVLAAVRDRLQALESSEA